MRKMILIICSLVLILLQSSPCFAARQVVKVGYFTLGDYYARDMSNQIGGYDVEYLNKIRMYSDLDFTYVDCGTWNNALKMLENKQIDLLGTAQWNEEREARYEFCLMSYGYTIGSLSALKSRNYIYEDYDIIGKSTIGVTKSYVRRKEVDKLFQEKGISPKIITYEGQKELEDALNSGEIDIMAANSHTITYGKSLLERFSYAPFFFMSWKGNDDLTDKIDAALIQIDLKDSGFYERMTLKYFPDILGTPLTKGERDLIAKGEIYTIYYSPDVNPLAWYDQSTDSMKGVLVDACQQITQITGLKIRVRPLEEQPAEYKKGAIKYTTLFYDSKEDIRGEIGVTEPLINEPFNLFGKQGRVVDLNKGKYTIGVVGIRQWMKEFVQELYPDCQVVAYNSPRECITKLENDEIDLAYLNVHVADCALTEMGVSDVQKLPLEERMHGIGMRFQGEKARILASIVDKGIAKLNREELNNDLVQYALATQGQTNLKTLYRDHPRTLFLLALGLVGLLMALAALVTYLQVVKKQKTKIEQANKAKSEFLSRMSHDMRTPMNGILGLAALSEGEQDISVLQDNMEKVKASGSYLLSLINDTLDFQRIESGKMQLNEEIVLSNTFLDNMFSMLKQEADRKGVALQIKVPKEKFYEYILLDKVRVQQVIINLISNAIKFTPAGGCVTFAIGILAREEEFTKICATVSDNGIGMSQEFVQSKLFQPFEQEANSITATYAGSGLGLSIAYKLVKLMGGDIEVASKLGEGTTFTIHVAFRRVPAAEAQHKIAETDQINMDVQKVLQGTHILLAEDHPLNATIAKKLLERKGCQVEVAANGQVAVELFSQNPPGTYQVILMDVRMPVLNGLEATKAIRSLAREDAQTIPIIAMTANTFEHDIQECLSVGMNDHIGKPLEVNRLYSVVAKYVQQERK